MYRVNAAVPVSGDGLSWESAFATVQEGIAAPSSIDLCCPCQVWVAEGTYYIYETSVLDSLTLRPGVHVFGGFGGVESSLDERDWHANMTALDGREHEGGSARVSHVVTGSDHSVLDGFTVTKGAATVSDDFGDPDNAGGGMLNWGVSPTVANCTFADNEASYQGGGMMNLDGATAVHDCVFTGNHAGYNGGGMRNEGGTPIVTGCTFEANTCGSQGGGMNNYDSGAFVSGCSFEGNYASWGGGGVNNHWVNEDNDVRYESSVFLDNGAAVWGGAMVNNSAIISIVNCSIAGNWADSAGGIRNALASDIAIVNSILWANSPDEIVAVEDASVEVSYSLITGGWAGQGNLGAPPLFEDPWSDDLRLQPESPCIDSADGEAAPSLDIDGNPRIDDPDAPNTGVGPPWADMGAYEHQP